MVCFIVFLMFLCFLFLYCYVYQRVKRHNRLDLNKRNSYRNRKDWD